MLATLFLVRTTMAFQFQAVAALSPLVMQKFAVGLTEIGLLIGLYLAPGIVIAYPGGAIGRRFGDSQAVAGGMLLMILGGVVMTLGTSWEAQVAGRVIAGTGGVVLNVLMSKMVQDWFAGREIATAMAIFVNSWPVGIAAALLALPLVAEVGGLELATGVVTALVAAGLMLLLAGYRAPARSQTGPGLRDRLFGAAFVGILVAGLIWALFNAALAMVFGFGPAILTERGWGLAEASSTTSLALWLVALSVPLGGVIADRTGRRDTVMLVGLVGFAALLIIAASWETGTTMFVLLGLFGGLAAGPIMSLPAEILTPGTRAQGMGIFFTIFYINAVMAPVIAGRIADAVGSASATFILGAALLLCCVALLAGLRALRRTILPKAFRHGSA